MSTLLIIEDEAQFRQNLREMLQLAGYEVLTAGDGESGLHLIRTQKPDLVLCDITMPRLNGYEVLAVLKAVPEIAHIPFVFITSRVEPCDRDISQALGADDYITKPFELTEITAVIERCLQAP